MASRSQKFDDSVKKLSKAVTKDMLRSENVHSDLRASLASYMCTDKNKKAVKEICAAALKNFEERVLENVATEVKTEMNFDRCQQLETRNKERTKWHINGDVQHDTYTQRRSVYIDFLEKLEEMNKRLTESCAEKEAQILKKTGKFDASSS